MFKKTFIGAAVAAIAATGALAQDFPQRPVQVVVPYSAGGSTDLSMRVVADAFERIFDDSTMVVRNQPGGGGAIGSSAAKRRLKTSQEVPGQTASTSAGICWGSLILF